MGGISAASSTLASIVMIKTRLEKVTKIVTVEVMAMMAKAVKRDSFGKVVMMKSLELMTGKAGNPGEDRGFREADGCSRVRHSSSSVSKAWAPL